ncbi:MAG: 16S rRNA (uracil(1498)-N(3))-methyltransferase [Betaproteobacteria bacterium]|nr:16S rRNA (uracil(1498)-N(3))-methyltransferase [Betaproteobacteria bacterium]
MPRLYCDLALTPGDVVLLPAGAARHIQVLRLQPGDALTLFNGHAGEYDAQVDHMGRQEVRVRVGNHHAIEREAPAMVHLVTGMPANDRMDWLVEKATELGVQRLTPLMTERSVLRLQGERAEKKLAHWQSVVVAASEQCGRNRLMTIDPVCTLAQWLRELSPPTTTGQQVRAVLSLDPTARPLGQVLADTAGGGPWMVVSGPEGGLSAEEESGLLQRGLQPVSLGVRVLRAETAAIAAVTRLVLA